MAFSLLICPLPDHALQIIVAVVCIINLSTQKWQLVWAVTAIVGLIVMGTPQLVEWSTMWQAHKAAKEGHVQLKPAGSSKAAPPPVSAP